MASTLSQVCPHRAYPILVACLAIVVSACSVEAGEPGTSSSPSDKQSVQGIPNPMVGGWVPHTLLRGSRFPHAAASITLERAAEAGINTLYVNVARNGCVYFETEHLPRCYDAGTEFDPFQTFIDLVEAEGHDFVVIPWWERFIQVDNGSKPHYAASELETIEDTANGLWFVDLDRESVRERLLGALVDLSRYGVPAIQIDDHLSYNAEGFHAEPEKYRSKLTRFVEFLVPAFRSRSGIALELAPNPMPFSSTAHLADWSAWPSFDRYVVQCYRSTAEGVLSEPNCPRAPGHDDVGIAAIGVAAGKMAGDEVVEVMDGLLARGQGVVLFEAGDIAAPRDEPLRQRMRRVAESHGAL